MRAYHSETNPISHRISSIDFLRGLVMVIMALDHVRMYFGYGTWYAEPTNLAVTTPLLFFTRWITHFCAPVFVFLAGASAYLRGTKNANNRQTAWYLFTRGVWLVLVELVIVNFGWTFDITYSFMILQVIWTIGLSMMALSALVFLPRQLILAIGLILVFGHNLLDPIRVQGMDGFNIIWYVLHQPNSIILNGRVINIYYPVLPWIGLMALGYGLGNLYQKEYLTRQRTSWLLGTGIGATLLFIILRLFNLYGEPTSWQAQEPVFFTLLSYLNTTKYPPSLQFILMTMGPPLIFLALSEYTGIKTTNPLVVFGRVPFLFYIVHIYFIHGLALLVLGYAGWDWREYILSADGILSGRLGSFGFGLEVVYVVWALIVVLLYPLCRWYQQIRENNPSRWWLAYL